MARDAAAGAPAAAAPVAPAPAQLRRGIPARAAFAGVAVAVLGMMLVIGGVITAGLFMPGVILILLSAVAFAISGVLHALERAGEPGRR